MPDKKSVLSPEPWEPLANLLGDTTERLGIPSWRADKASWQSHVDHLYPTTKELALTMLFVAESLLESDVGSRVVMEGVTWSEPGPCCVALRIRPHDKYYLRSDAPYRQPPPWGLHTGVGIEVELLGAFESSIPDYYIPPRLILKLSVGYLHIAPFRWLMTHWRRPLIYLLQSQKVDVFDNGVRAGFPKSDAKRYHGKDVLKKIEDYLFHSEGDPDQVFYLERELLATTTTRDVALVFASLLAVFDAIYYLSVPRCDPDCLHRHYLKLRPLLSPIPFRESFYAKV